VRHAVVRAVHETLEREEAPALSDFPKLVLGGASEHRL
jgi:hypothetical protein